jgi:hypothetical protein
MKFSGVLLGDFSACAFVDCEILMLLLLISDFDAVSYFGNIEISGIGKCSYVISCNSSAARSVPLTPPGNYKY